MAVLLLFLGLACQGLDVNGRWFDLAAFPGKTVVIEWMNPDCPPWRAYYDPPFLQDLQRKSDVIWVWVCSKKGVTAARLRAEAQALGAAPAFILLDASGRLAREFEPKATPHVFVLRDGVVLYRGAVDDGENVNYLGEALAAIREGRPVERAETMPFG